MFHPANARSGSSLWLGLIFASSIGQAGPIPTADTSTDEGTHYSSLADVNRTNVGRLGLAWEFDAFVVRGGIHRGAQATPVVVDGIMYFTGPWSVVYAVDARDGRPVWQYDPEVKGEFARHACCDAVNRGVTVQNGVVYLATLDGYLVALNAT